MELELKPDFEQVMKRFDAWWRCELVDRPLLTIPVISGKTPKLPAKTHPSLRSRWLDVEHTIDVIEGYTDAAVFVGETLPYYNPNIGPETCAALFGSEIEFSEYTSWSIPCMKNCRDIIGMKPDFENHYWKVIRDLTDLSIERGKGRWLTGISDLHMNGDLLAALRDPQHLCMDVAVDPEGVRAACDYATTFYADIYDDAYNRIAAAGMPSICWIPAPHYGRMNAEQCDFICMISPDSFADTILPSLEAECAFLDRSIYHLDGPRALCHLDLLLEMKQLNGIQWVYGAGAGAARDWIDVYKRIQAGGKCMQILCEDMEDAYVLMEHLKPEGVWFTFYRGYTRDEAEKLITALERWAADKR